MMIDKSLDKFLMVFFGISGIAILMLVWLRPTPESERILATFIGSVGLFAGSFRATALQLKKLGRHGGDARLTGCIPKMLRHAITKTLMAVK